MTTAQQNLLAAVSIETNKIEKQIKLFNETIEANEQEENNGN